VSYSAWPLRRASLVIAAVAALVSAVPAAAELRPVHRDFGELTLPRVRAGEIRIPAGQARGRVTVLVRLAQPPLAQWRGRTLQSSTGRHRLDVDSRSSRAYLARLDAAQRSAAAQLRRAFPEATIGRRFRVLLNALTVEIPARRLPALVRQSFATKVYPSFRYTLTLNDSPTLIGATEIAATTGARGDGVKIGVVDDGVDPTNPFFDPSGFDYPPGFPKGGTKWTTRKVIVARVFPGPGSGKPGRLALDPDTSFHGTHVAGIAAGDAGTTAPAGEDHPAVAGLSGVAPRAWIGNYRVFTVPTPLGPVANTPEIVAAFESAVEDGMDVINFSGGAPQTEPANDAMIETIRNVSAAGVVPVISAGNDRDEFGIGTSGSPGTAPDSISVAAVSNNQVFAPALSVVAPGAPPELAQVPFRPSPGGTPPSWVTTDQTVVDVTSVVGTNGAPVDARLCGPAGNPNGGASPLPAGSLGGAIVIVSRGVCTFASKALRAQAAGARGIILVDNRPGEANTVPIQLVIPSGMIADLDGARLRAYLARSAGRTLIRAGVDQTRIETGRGGTITSFSSAGPTAFGHDLKPDLSAPGGQILSSSLINSGQNKGPTFLVLDGTSMAAPHVTGAAALLVQRHPGWSAQEVKSALVSTAGPAWADTARTIEAPVLLGGSGLVNLPRADDPKLFTRPVSLSFDDLNVNGGARSDALLLRLSDAGDGAGSWQVEVRPQAATAGASLEVASTLQLASGGEGQLPVVARASADAAAGDNFGFLVLRRGEITRRVPYYFAVTRPALEALRATPLAVLQLGDTLTGVSRVSQYRFPAAAFGPAPDYSNVSMHQDGVERLYELRLGEPAVNLGVSVALATDGSRIDPWLLGSKDENDVQGLAGTPVNANNLTFDFRVDVGAAGASLPRPKSYFVAVDSARDIFTGTLGSGRYLLRAWVNDVVPPVIVPITTRVAAGRPTLALRIVDGAFGEPASGVDPLSIAIQIGQVLIGPTVYDATVGIAVFPIPASVPSLKAGPRRAVAVASDLQEAKNVNTSGSDIMPNTAFRAATLRVVDGPTVDWLVPETNACATQPQSLLVVTGSTARIRSVRFLDGDRTIANVTRGAAGLYGANWTTRSLKRGRHVLRADVTDVRGRTATTTRRVRLCSAG
jgi:minor extracellular serine protease Vpr